MFRCGTIEYIDETRGIGIIVDSNLQDIEFILPDSPEIFYPGLRVVFDIEFLESGLKATNVSERVYYSLHKV